MWSATPSVSVHGLARLGHGTAAGDGRGVHSGHVPPRGGVWTAFLERAHLFDRRFFKPFAAEWARLGVTSGDNLLSINILKTEHTASVSSYFNEMGFVNPEFDEQAYASLTQEMNRRIRFDVSGPLDSDVFVVETGETKLVDVLAWMRQIAKDLAAANAGYEPIAAAIETAVGELTTKLL